MLDHPPLVIGVRLLGKDEAEVARDQEYNGAILLRWPVLTMRQFLRVLIWLVAALFCAVTTVVWAYMATFVGSIAFRFSIESSTALTWLHGSMAIFAVMSCAFLAYLGIKMAKGDL